MIAKGINIVDFNAKQARDGWARNRYYQDVDSGLMPKREWTMTPLHVRQLYWSLYDRQHLIDQPAASNPIANVLRFIRQYVGPSTQQHAIEVRK